MRKKNPLVLHEIDCARWKSIRIIDFVCHDCNSKNRRNVWKMLLPCESVLTFVENKDNTDDSNAIKVVARGDYFGTAGFVGEEFAENIRKSLARCEGYKIDMIDQREIGNRDMHLRMYCVA